MVNVIVKNMETKESHIVQAEKTVGDLKSSVQTQFRIPTDDQILITEQIELLQGDNYLLENMGIDEATEIKLFTKINPPRNVVVEIDFEDDILDIVMFSEDTILTLKKEIDRNIGLSPFRQDLTALGAEVIESYKVRDYMIGNSNPTIKLRRILQDPDRSIDILLATIVGRIPMKVDPLDSIYSLHGDIRRAGIAINDENYYLRWKDQELEGEKTFQEYEIRKNAVLRLTRRGSPPPSQGSPPGHRMDPSDLMLDN